MSVHDSNVWKKLTIHQVLCQSIYIFVENILYRAIKTNRTILFSITPIGIRVDDILNLKFVRNTTVLIKYKICMCIER